MNKYQYFPLFLISILLISYSCDNSTFDTAFSDSASGQGGSMARFAISGDHLYVVENNALKTFDISNASSPKLLETRTQYLDFGVETIFAMDTLLFIGSQSGMYIFNISRPAFPQALSHTWHLTSCDPVVANGNYAYVTLNSNSRWCGRTSNLLIIYDISDVEKPVVVKEIRGLTNPKGLGIIGTKLFLCDNGLKLYDINNPASPVWKSDLGDVPEIKNVDSYDVIPVNDILFLIGSDGLYQFKHENYKLSFVSKIAIKRNNQ